MRLLTLIFGDRYAEHFGRELLKYFNQDDFPKEILKYPELNLLYRRAKYDQTTEEYNDELIDLLEAMIAIRNKELHIKSKESAQ